MASLQRASEGQCSQLQHEEQTEQAAESLIPTPKDAAATSTATPTSSQAHSHSTAVAESADGGIEERASSCAIEKDVVTLDDHQKQLRNTEASCSSTPTHLPPIHCIVDAALTHTPPRGSSLPPLAPPPPPLAPPPPPAVSAPGLMTTQRVVQYEPRVPMKPLFWKKLQYSALEVRGQDIVWSNTSEPGQHIYLHASMYRCPRDSLRCPD